MFCILLLCVAAACIVGAKLLAPLLQDLQPNNAPREVVAPPQQPSGEDNNGEDAGKTLLVTGLATTKREASLLQPIQERDADSTSTLVF